MHVCGKNVVYELLNNNDKIYKIYVFDKFNDNNLINKLIEKNIPIKYVDRKTLDNICDNNQGIVAEISDYRYYTFDEIVKEKPFYVMLDHITDPHNFGAIIRTCEAAGVDAIIIPRNRSVSVNSTVMKTSAGTLNKVRICLVNNLVDTINKLKKNNVWIVGTDMDGICYSDIDVCDSICLVIGNEGDGISRLVSNSCDLIASIPMKGTVNSLNASVAAGIIIFDVSAKRGL